MKNFDERILVKDKSNLDILDVINPFVHNPVTMSNIISDWLEHDYRDKKHGLIIDYGFEPNGLK